jgi:exodeoxyribonuclease VII large subunit
MAKLKSQWEFGELFPAQTLRRILSVSELTLSVKRLLEQQIGRVWITGEVTNLRLQSSGHLYFALKDATAQLNCVLFRAEARSFNRDLLRDGLSVNLQGEFTVYEARGQYQLIVAEVELQGVGALQVLFEKLKQKLQAEGLFAPERKRPLPRYPRRVGIVTSRTGAALRDVLQAVQRRHPGLEIILASCRVQGQGAGDEVAGAIRLLNDWSAGATADPRRQIDLLLVTRGGGSLEDLWAFNEEALARAIFESRIPVLSAVGHEIDFTISDFVADFRAATPTAAAEIMTEGFYSIRPFILEAREQLAQLARKRIAAEGDDLDHLIERLQRQHPRRWLHEQWQRLDDLQNTLVRCTRYGYRTQYTHWQVVAQRLLRLRPSQVLARRHQALDLLVQRWLEQSWLRWRELKQRLVTAESRLRLLSPQNVLDRGYSITMNTATGQVIRSETEVQPGQMLTTRLSNGRIKSVIPSS